MSTNLAYAEPVIPEGQFRQEDDRHLMRFAWKGGGAMDLNRFMPSQFVGAFPDDIISAHQLVIIPEARSLGPFEAAATIMSGDGSVMQQGPNFSPGSEGMVPAPTSATPDRNHPNRGSRLTRFTNSPKMCGFILMRKYESEGLCLFEQLKGTPKDEMRKLYSLFMPVRANGSWDMAKIQALGWEMEREVLSQRVSGPFLSDIREHLREGGTAGQWLQDTIKPGTGKMATAEQRRDAKYMLLEMRSAATRSWAFLNTRLNDTEKEIRRARDGKPGKEYYDSVDERFTGGVLPLDIVAMANTNRAPIDLQAAREQSAREENQNSTMMQGFNMIADKIGGNGSGVTAEDVQKMLAENDAKWVQRIKDLQNGEPISVLDGK